MLTTALTVLNIVSLKSYLANQLLRQHVFENIKKKILDMKIGNIWKQIQRREPHTDVHTNVNNQFELIYIMRSIISVALNFIFEGDVIAQHAQWYIIELMTCLSKLRRNYSAVKHFNVKNLYTCFRI